MAAGATKIYAVPIFRAAYRRIARPSPRAHSGGVTKAWLLIVAALAILAVTGLGGCSAGRCVAPPDWPDTLVFMKLPDQDAPFERFSIDSSGRILWTGFPRRPTPVSRAEFRKILETVSDGGQEPWLVLDAPAEADCATVRAVRAEMDRMPHCRRGHCVDGKAWDRSDPPKGF